MKAGLVDALEESKESVVQGGCVGLVGGAVVAMAVVREEGYGSGGSHAIQVVPVAPEGESEDEVRLGCMGQWGPGEWLCVVRVVWESGQEQ